MEVIFNHASLRAKQARFASRVGGPGFLILLQIVGGTSFAGGLWLILSGYRLGGILLSISLAILVWMLWFYQDLNLLPAKLTQVGGQINLDQELDKEVLAKLPIRSTALDIYNAAKGSYDQHFLFNRFGLSDDYFKGQLSSSQIDIGKVWSVSQELSNKYELGAITAGAVLVSLVLNTPLCNDFLSSLHIDQEDLEKGLGWIKQTKETINLARERENFGGWGRDWAAGYTPLLNQLGHNVSLDVQYGGLYVRETANRKQVVDQMLSVLANSSSSSVALVGDLGVGKTTAVFSLAKKLLTQKVPTLRYHQIYSLDASTLISSAKSARPIEQIVTSLFNEAIRAKNIIIFLDEAQLFFHQGTGSVDLSSVLLPVLQSGRLHLICAMTPAEWQLLSVNNPSLAGLFNSQVMSPPSRDDALQIMQDHLLFIEAKHKVNFTYQALQEAYRLAEKYMRDQAFPGRGVQILEQTAVFAGGQLITAEIVGQSLEAKLGVKVTQAGAAEKQQLLNLEDELHKRLINQTQAVKVVSNALRRARSGVGNPNKPVGTFLFLGPTGVGKTELSKALADVYFHGRDQIIRVNLNEYSQPQDVSRLLTAATGQDGGNSFLASINRQPYSVVLLDEIEKAHAEVLNVLLQMLDEGTIRDNTNREASFKDAIIIATSNAGADMIRSQIEAGYDLEQFQEQLVGQLIDQKVFTPEFLNRFDEIVLFRPLKPDELRQVVGLMIDEINKTLARQKVSVSLTPAAVDWLVNTGNDPRLGARPMRRQIQRTVEDFVARKLLDGTAKPGAQITLDAADLSPGAGVG